MKQYIELGDDVQTFNVSFNELCIVERTDIPKEYGLITYTQDKIITIT